MSNNAYRHPRPGVAGRVIESIANSRTLARLRRAVMSRLPFLTLQSEVADIVYLNWLVPVAACSPFVPAGVSLWQRDGLTPFTILTYRHSHFGPSLLGPLRRFFPSPLQSNWRLYVAQPVPNAPDVPTVLFLKNVMDSLPYALGTRLFSDALPTHLAERFVHQREGDTYRTLITPGTGSAPTLACSVRTGDEPSLSPAFASTFGTWREAVEFLACQDAAIAPIEAGHGLAFAEIELPIDIDAVQHASTVGPVDCALLSALQSTQAPLCFVVPRVRFRVVSERVLPTP